MRIKLVSIFIIVVVLAAFIPICAGSSVYAANKMVVSASAETTAPGQEVTVKVSAENNSGFTGYVIWLNYDTDVFTFKSAESKLSGSFVTSDYKSNRQVTGKNFAFMGNKDVSDDGVLFEVTFTVDSNASYGNYDFEIGYSEKNTINNDGDKVSFDTINGKVELIKPTFTVSNATGCLGETVDVDISVSGNTGFAAYLINFDYDTEHLEYVSAEDKIGSGLFYVGDKKESDSVVGKSVVYTGANNYLKNSTILSLKFKIKENASASSYPVTISYSKQDTLDENGNQVEFETKNGSITATLPSINISDLKISGTNICFNLNCSDSLINKQSSMCIAYYDDKGRMIDCFVDASFKLKSGLCTYAKSSKSFNKYKVMIYDNGFGPMCGGVGDNA